MASGPTAEPSIPNPERQVRYTWAAQLLAGSEVLDAACGRGWGTATLAAAGAIPVGVDLSAATIADARAEHGELAEFYEGNLRNLPFGDGEFDNVVCFEALAQVADTARVLDELRRVLRPGGLLLVSAPNRDAYPPGNPLHLAETSSAELERLLAARFAHVAMHRQQTYFASLLCDSATLARAGPAASIDAATTKLAAGPAGSELHAVAVATDGELPAAPALLALGESVDYVQQQRLLEEWQERAVQAEAKALALERELHSAQS